MLCTKEMVFQQNLLEKAYFIAKMSGPTMVRPASSDFWKAPLDGYNNTIQANVRRICMESSEQTGACIISPHQCAPTG